MTDTGEVEEQGTKLADVLGDLTRPFPPEDIKWRVQNFSAKNKTALVVPYLDARHIQERLDKVVPGEWSLEFKHKPLDEEVYVGGHVVYARMTICGVTREDVGSSYILKDSNVSIDKETGLYNKIDANKVDPKTATSDSIKRVAAQFGIGHYLWNMDMSVWIDANDGSGNNKFKRKMPKYKDIDKKYHDYLMELGKESHITKDSHVDRSYGTLDVSRYLLQQVKDGQISAENMLSTLDEYGEKAVSSVIARMRSEGNQ